MGITSSLYSGVSGLNAHTNAMTVVGNNIANTNTIGFKGARTLFSDLLSDSISSSSGASQVGRGVNISSVDNIFSQGTFQTTESSTDLSIEGQGFFIIREGAGQTGYTRAGSFTFNSDGYLTTPDGWQVQGYTLDSNGKPVGDLTDIWVNTETFTPANATSAVSVSTNINSATPAQTIATPSPTNNDYTTSIQVFDSLGETHLITTYYLKTGPLTWDYNTVVDGGELNGGTAGLAEVVSSGQLIFDSSGELSQVWEGATWSYNAGTSTWTRDVTGLTKVFDPADATMTQTTPTVNTSTMDWANAATDQNIAFTLNTTQYASTSVVNTQSQDGYTTGTLVALSIDNQGNVLGNYTNGDPRKLARIALAKFTNPSGLIKSGNNRYLASDTSGEAVIGTVGSGVGKLFTYSLEQSNVDLAKEFVTMITVQRGFQANSKIITTTDEMMAELINLKR